MLEKYKLCGHKLRDLAMQYHTYVLDSKIGTCFSQQARQIAVQKDERKKQKKKNGTKKDSCTRRSLFLPYREIHLTLSATDLKVKYCYQAKLLL